jgi:tRNA threonylcarbamoyladenosine biosynthesis protein TsaE
MRRTIETASAEETTRLGAALGRTLRGGEVIGLSGDLGAGKTQLVRGLAEGLDLPPDVIYSPSFTLVAEHEGRLRLNHIDLFRLGEPVEERDEEEIGLGDYLSPSGVTAIEWHEKLSGAASRALTLAISIATGEDDGRTIELVAASERGREILTELAATLSENR